MKTSRFWLGDIIRPYVRVKYVFIPPCKKCKTIIFVINSYIHDSDKNILDWPIWIEN